ncbi:MAG TPA: ISKra4 family transposase [Blastocatellia bacterium]|nr:ISKra4 family transposase [Blastocatellia bacterium]
MAACAAIPEPVQADTWLSAQEQFHSIKSHLRSTQARRMNHSELEEFLDREGRELLRRMLQAHLDERGPGSVDQPVVDAKGQEHTHQRLRSRSITTIFGEVTLDRQSYGGRGLKSLHPLDAELNLPPESYSHTLQRRIAETSAKESFDEVASSIRDRTGVTVPKRQLEETARRASRDFELFYARQRAQTAREAQKTGPILVVTVDGKGIPMRKSDLREATRKAAEERQPRLQHRRSRGEKAHTKRMSTVAAVYTIEPFVRAPEQIVRELGPVHETLPQRPRPEDKRVWASVKRQPEAIIDQAFEEARRRDPKHNKEWIALVDGNETQLDMLHLAAKDYRVELVTILDLIHVLEYLWKAAWAFHDAGDRAAETWVSQRLVEILRGRSSSVAAGIRRSATLRGLSDEQRAPIDDCADYLLKYRAFLHYDRYLAKGYPIATGVIEGACRYLVKDRMEKTGARWSLEGAEAVLRLRSLRASGDFDEYWDFHIEQEYKRNHESRYENGQTPLPNPEPGRKEKASRLRLVK